MQVVGINVANISIGMNLPDFLIIYLACGAPFGVYYYLQNRNQTGSKILMLKSVIRFIFWIPFAIQLVARNSFFTKLYNNDFAVHGISDSNIDFEIEEIKKNLELKIKEVSPEISIFEFREIFDRYAGLSLEILSEDRDVSIPEKEIFRIASHSSQKIGEACLNRRNRLRLSYHQKLARKDFFEIFEKLTLKSEMPQNLFKKVLRLADMLNDIDARQRLEILSRETLQTIERSNVSKMEQEIWKTAKHQPFTENKISTNLQIMTATANSSNKD